MAPTLFGIEHILYIVISTIIGALCILLGKKFLKTEMAQTIFLKSLGVLLFIAILANRLSQVFSWGGEPDWDDLIPDSFCGMTSLVLALGVIFGKKDNLVYHAVWLLAIFGGVATVAYANFLGQHPSFFFPPTITGLLHHSLSALVVVALFAFKQINVTYKKWFAPLFGLTTYMTVGAFLIGFLGLSDAFHIFTPLISGTPFTAWVMGPIYLVAHGLIFLIFELVRKRKISN